MNISDDKKRAIWAACDEVNATAEKVTMSAVRDYMGGGSLSYISPVLREWKESQRPKFVISEDLPEEAELATERNVRQVAHDFAAVYKKLFDEELVKATADLEARLKASNEQNIELEQYSSDLEKERDALKLDNEHLQQQCADHLEEIRLKDSQISTLQSNLEQTKERLNSSENAMKDLEREHKTLSQSHERVSHQATEQQDKLAVAQKELTRTLEQAASQQETIKSCQDAVKAKDAQITRMEEKISAQTEKMTAQREEIATKNEQITRLEEKNIAQAEKNVGQSEQVAQLNSKLASQRERLENLLKVKADFTTAQARIRELAQESGEVKLENKALHKELGGLSAKLKILEKNSKKK